MPADGEKRNHLVITNTLTVENYTSPNRGGSQSSAPIRNRADHGQFLISRLNQIKERSQNIFQEQEALGLERGLGIRIQFDGSQGESLAIESLARDNRGIELLNTVTIENRVQATVFVPEGKLDHFEKLLKQYLEEETAKGNPKNLNLINSIDQIRESAFAGLWTDDNTALPADEEEIVDWEIWLPVRNDRTEVLDRFRHQATQLDLRVSESHLEFPERTVVTVRSTKRQIVNSVRLLDSIAEIRRVKETAEFFTEMPNVEQFDWIDDFLQRVSFPTQNSPHILILDTGVNKNHPLIQPLLADGDLLTIDPDWGTNDADGHGSGMAGLAIYGDLSEILGTANNLDLTHRLESVKLLRHDGDNDHRHHGDLTSEAISRAEVNAPHRIRITCMAVTSVDNRDRGRPSAWSATIDTLASDSVDDTRRLIVLAAGNVERQYWINYPDGNSLDTIHDPGQSWNGLTVGAYTRKITISDDAPNYTPLASSGGLSPHSTTSATWQNKWPLKPDVVFEGGNVADDGLGPVTVGSLQLLTTYHLPQNRLLDYFNATSAATALASKMAAEIFAYYPHLWPETVRALMVHSARWTDAMTNHYLPANPNTSHYEQLIKHCGFGVPNLDRALSSANNALTLIVEGELQPFWKDGPNFKTKDMGLHTIPWPMVSLEELAATQVEMKVTLSYFVEPNPSARGFGGRYRYASHGLRFDVRRADETEDDFRARVNQAARDEEEGTEFGGYGGGWLVGKQKRHRGSLHCDTWRGTAADLANRSQLAVYPAIGWWRERHHLLRYTKKARYALLISIETPETELDIYTEVANLIAVPAEIIV